MGLPESLSTHRRSQDQALAVYRFLILLLRGDISVRLQAQTPRFTMFSRDSRCGFENPVHKRQTRRVLGTGMAHVIPRVGV